MCVICKDYIKGSLTWNEAWKNMLEMVDSEHKNDLAYQLIKSAPSIEVETI